MMLELFEPIAHAALWAIAGLLLTEIKITECAVVTAIAIAVAIC